MIQKDHMIQTEVRTLGSFRFLKRKVSYFCKTVKNLKKEVIHGHLPVAVPCYDFTLVISRTLGASFPKGLGSLLRVRPTTVV